jgi:molybdopterin converting factor small subunit
VVEGDKSKEYLVRQMNNAKDVENDKLRELERAKDAEIKLLEKLNESLKREKRDVEERLEESLLRQDIITSKHAEEHHNTVKYFE